jgi:hypothetical protein
MLWIGCAREGPTVYPDLDALLALWLAFYFC